MRDRPAHDVIVLGAGPAGCATATRLAEAGHDVVVLERDPAAAGVDRTSAEVIAPGTQHELELLDVPVAGTWVLDEMRAVRNVFPDMRWITYPFPDGFRYYHVDRAGLDAALRARTQRSGAALYCDARVDDVELRADRAIARSADGREWTARLLVDASGRNSPVLRRFRLKRDETCVRQIGVAIFFDAFDGTLLHAWDRHFTGGPGGMISGSRMAPGQFRWILETDLDAKQASGMQPAAYFEHVAAQHDPWIAERLATQPRTGRVWSMAPIGYRVDELTRDRLLLVGDAAGYLSPVTGQGIEFAMRSARVAAATADKALHADDLRAAAFGDYVEGHQAEVAAQVAIVREFLMMLRDAELVARAPDDRTLLRRLLGGIADLPGEERGTL
jgi:flavin-dependent dehydrogenase